MYKRQGLGFAIPIGLARNVMMQLATTGSVQRGTLGIDTQTVDSRMAQGLGLDTPRGAVITRVYGGSPAARAGLRTGDVVVAANGERIDNSESLRNFQGLQALDTPVTLDVLRDGRTVKIETRLTALPRDGASVDARLAGAMFADLPEALRRQNQRAGGVLVETVESGSRAFQSGLREGDLILAANSGQFRDLAGFRDSLADRPADLVLRISRRGRIVDVIMR